MDLYAFSKGQLISKIYLMMCHKVKISIQFNLSKSITTTQCNGARSKWGQNLFEHPYNFKRHTILRDSFYNFKFP